MHRHLCIQESAHLVPGCLVGPHEEHITHIKGMNHKQKNDCLVYVSNGVAKDEHKCQQDCSDCCPYFGNVHLNRFEAEISASFAFTFWAYKYRSITHFAVSHGTEHRKGC